MQTPRRRLQQSRMKCFFRLFALLLVITVPKPVVSKDSERTQILEVVVTTYDVSRTETLIYLRVVSDGSAEAHPTRKIDFTNLGLNQAQIPSLEMAKIREFLAPGRTENWYSQYD